MGLVFIEKKPYMLHNNSGSFFQKKKSVTWIKLISDILKRINRFQVSFDTDDGHCVWSWLFFFLVYFLIKSSFLATPTPPPCHQISSFGQPTHPPLWWRNTWMPLKVFVHENYNIDFPTDLMDVNNNQSTLLNLRDLYYHIEQKTYIHLFSLVLM